MKQLLFIILVFYSNLAFGQIGIIGSTTVTANTPITFSTDDSSQSYVWDTVAVDIGDTLRGTMAQLQGGQFNGSVCYLVKFDPVSNNWYGFTVNGGTFLRVNLGSNPLNTSPSSIDTMGTVNSMITNGGAMWADIARFTIVF